MNVCKEVIFTLFFAEQKIGAELIVNMAELEAISGATMQHVQAKCNRMDEHLPWRQPAVQSGLPREVNVASKPSTYSRGQGELVRRKTTHTARDCTVYQNIFNVLHSTALKGPEEEDTSTSKGVCCLRCDYCCWSCCQKECNVISDMPLLKMGRAQGWKLQYYISLPFVRTSLRKTLIWAQLITVLSILALTAATFSLRKNSESHLVFILAVSVIASALTITDAFFSLSTCKHCVCVHKEGQNEEGGSCIDSVAEEHPNTSCVTNVNITADFIRLFLTDIVFYTLLMYSIFDLIINETYKFENTSKICGFVLFMLSAFSYIVYVYIVRVSTIIGVIKSTQKFRTPTKPSRSSTSEIAAEFDYSISKSALKYQICFVVHIFLQMAAQVSFIIAIAAKTTYENQRCANETTAADGIHSVNYIWQSLGGYLLPLLGLFMFFLITYDWGQMFHIGLCIDLISVFRTMTVTNALNSNDIPTKIREIAECFQIEPLKNEFKLFKRTLFHFGFSPVMIILCIFFTAIHVVYIVFLVLTAENINGACSESMFKYIYWAGILVGFLINPIAIAVYVVSLLWIFIIVIVIIFLLVICALILFFCPKYPKSIVSRIKQYVNEEQQHT